MSLSRYDHLGCRGQILGILGDRHDDEVGPQYMSPLALGLLAACMSTEKEHTVARYGHSCVRACILEQMCSSRSRAVSGWQAEYRHHPGSQSVHNENKWILCSENVLASSRATLD